MNKRIKKKHQWLGTKLAGANHCAFEIAQHILRKMEYAGISPKPSYVRNVRRHVRWFFHHSSEKEWSKRAAAAYYPKQMYFSAKHLLMLPADYESSIERRYEPNPVVKDMLDELAEKRKARKEELLSGVNAHIDDMHSLEYLIKSYEEYGATGSKRLSQEEE
jgi:hypothetical protein